MSGCNDTERSRVYPDPEDENFYLIENEDDYIFFVNEEDWTDIYSNIWINNPPVDLRKEKFRVLNIGNSFTIDATHYIKEIMAGCDIIPPNRWSVPEDMSMICAIRGGGSWKNWYDIYNDYSADPYSIYKAFGGLTDYLPTPEADGTFIGSRGLRELFANNLFDLIIIHPMSYYAPYYERWEEDSDAGYLSEIIDIIRTEQPQATIGFMLVHSYSGSCVDNKEGSCLGGWEKIVESTKLLKENYDIDFIIPYGTALQNLRQSTLNNEPFDLTEDGKHCASGVADYTATCGYYEAVIAPRYEKSVMGCTARIPQEMIDADIASLHNLGLDPQISSYIPVTDENAILCQAAAWLAVNQWDTLQNPEEFLRPSSPDDPNPIPPTGDEDDPNPVPPTGDEDDPDPVPPTGDEDEPDPVPPTGDEDDPDPVPPTGDEDDPDPVPPTGDEDDPDPVPPTGDEDDPDPVPPTGDEDDPNPVPPTGDEDDPDPVPPTGEEDDPDPIPPTEYKVSDYWRGIKLSHYKDNIYVMINHSGKTPEKILFNHGEGSHINRTPELKYISRSTYYPDGYAFPEIETGVKEVCGSKIEFGYADGKITYRLDASVVDAHVEVFSIDGKRFADINLPLCDGLLHTIELPVKGGFYMACLSCIDNAVGGLHISRNIKILR